ncbi:MAG: 3-hydroxyacyl-CoA dehydrogenase family protein [Planctomycetota bacterium]
MTDAPVAVLGAGTMGIGVAADLLLHGHGVILIDPDPAARRRAATAVRQAVRFAPLARPAFRRAGLPAPDAMDRLALAAPVEAAQDCTFVIENVTEERAVKAEVYGALGAIGRADAVFAANTSCIPIGWLGEISGRPAQTLGVHFMNPAYLQTTVEVIPSAATDAACIARWSAFLGSLGKESVVVADVAGFVSSRISHVMINEAARVAREGVASPAEIDRIFRDCHRHALGPFQTADLIGIDTVVRALAVLHAEHGLPHYAPDSELRAKVDAGRLGRKTGGGFYDYPPPPADGEP